MEEFSINNTAEELVQGVNTNFGEGMEVLDTDDSATDFIEKLNANFSHSVDGSGTSVFPEGTVLSQDMGVLKEGEDISGMTLDDFIRYGINGEERTLRFLHYSDPHGYSQAVGKGNELMSDNNDIAFAFITGDFSQYENNILSSDLEAGLDAAPVGKLFMCSGNHDAYEMAYNGASASQQTTTNFIKHYMEYADVEWGDGDVASGVASYWYKDVMVGSKKLRIITLDQYEIDNVRKVNSYPYYPMYSQAQINWLIARLSELDKEDYFIIAMHTPPFRGFYKDNFWPYADATGDPTDPTFNKRLFVSECIVTMGNERGGKSVYDQNLIPRIIDAHINRKAVNFTYNNLNSVTPVNPDITVNVDFRGAEPSTFLFYLCGHTHWDETYYLPDATLLLDPEYDPATINPCGGDWRDQLMLCITASYYNTNYSDYDDLGGLKGPTNPYFSQDHYVRINDITIDFALKKIKIERVGHPKTVQGRVRDYITFPFKRDIQNKYSILHLSDTHGGTACINNCVSYAKNNPDVGFILHTGDISTASNSTGSYDALIDADCAQPTLAILGNHDAHDVYENNDATAKTALRDINKTNVEWGDYINEGDTVEVKYWYKDVTTDAGKTIRFIALDEYDFSDGASHAQTLCYTKRQIEWFLDLLYDTPSLYYIVLIVHQPLQTTVGASQTTEWSSYSNPDTSIGYAGPDASFIPSIIKAYKNKEEFTGSYDPLYSPGPFNVEKDFRGHEPATFICYLGGHIHGDWHKKLSASAYSDQLISCVAMADAGSPSSNSINAGDIDRSSKSWVADKVTFDLSLRKVIIERLGATLLKEGKGERTRIVFDF